MSDQEQTYGAREILARRLGMSLEEFQKLLRSSGDDVCDRLGMSAEEFRGILKNE